MSQQSRYPFFDGNSGMTPPQFQQTFGQAEPRRNTSEYLEETTRSAGIRYYGEALARIPSLERTGTWIVLGFTTAFAIFLILMNLAGQIPGQSFSLKSISDCLQFTGECIGLGFTVRIVGRLHKASWEARQKLMHLESMSGSSNSELVTARAEAQDASRSYWAWLLLSIAIALYASGQAIWTSYDVRMPSAEVPFPGLYDIGFVSSYPFFIAGALLLTRRSRSNRAVLIGRVRVLLDAVLVIGAAFSLSWFFILSPSVAGLSQQPGAGAAFLAIYFPGGDLLLVVLGALLMFSQFSTREQQPVFARLCLGLFFLAVTDSILVWLSLSFAFNTGTIQDVLWPLSMQMVGLAAIAYPRSVALEQEKAAKRGANQAAVVLNTNKLAQAGPYFQTAAPFVLALGSAAILLTLLPEAARSQQFIASLIALILFILVTIRQTLTLNENNRLRLQLAGELVLSRRALQVTRREADQALHEAQDKQQLEQGVLALQAVHARIAHGDFSVRAATDPGPLQAVAVSFNLMIERLKDLIARANRYEQLLHELSIIQKALDQLSQGMAPWPSLPNPQNKTELRALYLGVERVQRFQSSQWRSLLMALERTVAPLARINKVLNTGEPSSGYLENPALSGRERGAAPGSEYLLQQIDLQMQRLIEQIRAEIGRLEGRADLQEHTQPPQQSHSQPGVYRNAQAGELRRPTSQPLQ